MIEKWEARTGRKAEVSHRSIDERKAKLAANPSDFLSFLIVTYAAGKGVVGPHEAVSNSVYPGWNQRSVVDTILDIYKQ